MIAACSINDVIGKGNEMLWHIPNDLKRFKKLTLNHKIIMGRKTYDSLPFKPLKNRTNIIISKSVSDIKGCIVVDTIQKAIDLMDDDQENFIIGGGEIYKQFLPYANKIMLTTVHTVAYGDVVFPKFKTGDNDGDWKLDSQVVVDDDKSNNFIYSYETYSRNINVLLDTIDDMLSQNILDYHNIKDIQIKI